MTTRTARCGRSRETGAIASARDRRAGVGRRRRPLIPAGSARGASTSSSASAIQRSPSRRGARTGSRSPSPTRRASRPSTARAPRRARARRRGAALRAPARGADRARVRGDEQRRRRCASTTRTTRISTSVKPRAARARPRAAQPVGSEVPRADVGVDAGAAGLAVGAEAEHVDLAAQARIEVLVRVAPGILRQPLEVAVRLPVRRHRRAASGRATSAARPCSVGRDSAGCRGGRASAPA